MTSAQRLPEVTFEEYLHAELATDQRCEWVGGEVYAMSGGSERHDLLAGLLYRVLAPAAEARGCRAFQQNRKVKLQDAAYYYPDVLVVCPSGSRPDRLFERDLTIVVEVLSPSTERIDRVEKASAYVGAPSFELYVVADPERRRIELGRPDGGHHCAGRCTAAGTPRPCCPPTSAQAASAPWFWTSRTCTTGWRHRGRGLATRQPLPACR